MPPFAPGASNGYISGNELFGDFTCALQARQVADRSGRLFRSPDHCGQPRRRLHLRRHAWSLRLPVASRGRRSRRLRFRPGGDAGVVRRHRRMRECGLRSRRLVPHQLQAVGPRVEADRGEVLIAANRFNLPRINQGPAVVAGPFSSTRPPAFKPVFNGAEHALRCRHVESPNPARTPTRRRADNSGTSRAQPLEMTGPARKCGRCSRCRSPN